MTSSFTDCRGRVWDLAITPAIARRVRHEIGYDLDNIRPTPSPMPADVRPDQMAESLGVIFAIVRPHAKERGVAFAEFAAACIDTIRAARDAFVAALLDYVPFEQRDTLALELTVCKTTEAMLDDRIIMTTHIRAIGHDKLWSNN